MPDVKCKVVTLDNPNGLVDAAILEATFEGDFPGWEREHAAIFETSMMWALRPDLVKADKIKDDEATVVLPYDVVPAPKGTIPASGVLWHATKASREKGLAIVDSMVEGIGNIIKTEF
jgi:creatinine amidohydrolase